MRARIQKYLTNEWQSLAKLAERCSTKKDRNPFADIIDELQRQNVVEVWDNYVAPRTKKETTAIRLTAGQLDRGQLSEVTVRTSGVDCGLTPSATALKGLSAVVVVRPQTTDPGQLAQDMNESCPMIKQNTEDLMVDAINTTKPKGRGGLQTFTAQSFTSSDHHARLWIEGHQDATQFTHG